MAEYDDLSESAPLAVRLQGYERRRLALKDAGMPVTYDELAEALGTHKSNVARLFAGERKRVSMDEEQAVQALLARYEAEATKRTGRTFGGPGMREDQTDFIVDGQRRLHTIPLASSKRIPVFGLASAGTRVELNHASVVDYVDIDDILAARSPSDRFILEVTGSSMEPRYFQGERVLCVKNRPPRPGDDCVIEFKDGHADLKRYVARRGGQYQVEQWNTEDPAYDPAGIFYHVEKIRALHAVVANLR